MSEPGTTEEPPPPPVEKWSRAPAFAFPDFRRLLSMRLANTLGTHGQAVAVGWQVYDIGGNPFHLGLIGLVSFLPSVLLVLFTGAVADRYDRRTIAVLGFMGVALCAVTFMTMSWAGVSVVWPFILLIGVVGTIRAFLLPCMQALTANVVPPSALPNAIALNSMAARGGGALGPMAGGILYGLSPVLAYGSFAVMLACGALLAASLRTRSQQIVQTKGPALAMLTAGLTYIGRTKVLLGALTFDFFAGLMAGVQSLLPVFAKDILEAGPEAAGLLRAAPGFGAALVAAILSVFPFNDRAGLFVFVTIGIYGASSIVFGLSETLWLSVLALFIMGGADICSAYFRWSIVQLWTPDAVRGRVSAVTSISATGSTELGDFRAGMFAGLFGPVPAVVAGGVIAIAGCFLWARLFPDLLRIRNMEVPEEAKKSAA